MRERTAETRGRKAPQLKSVISSISRQTTLIRDKDWIGDELKIVLAPTTFACTPPMHVHGKAPVARRNMNIFSASHPQKSACRFYAKKF